MTPREWMEEVRGISAETAVRLGVVMGTPKSPGAVGIPYVRNGDLVGHKVRAIGDKRFSWAPKGVSATLWNVDILGDDTLRDQPAIVTEGEFDALSCIEAGFPRTVSVPNGAQSGARYVLEHADKLKKSPCVIIAADADDEGTKFLRAAANALDGHPVRWVAYPEGCKDANDVLRQHGAGKLVECINAAKMVFPDDPQGGLITGFSDAPPAPDGEIYRTGCPATDKVIAWHVGFPTVVTGVPGAGKSTWLIWALRQAIQRHGIRVGASLLETPWPVLRDQLARLDMGRPWDALAKIEKDALHQKLDSEWRLMHRVEGAQHDLGWWREMMWVAAIRDRCKVIVLDPWNEVDHIPARSEAMTDYVNAALAHIRMWAERFDVSVCIVAHPTKMQREVGAKPLPPMGYDISGSSAWYNKAAIGVTVHQDRDDGGDFTRIICWKSKFTQLYGFGKGHQSMTFDPQRLGYYPRAHA